MGYVCGISYIYRMGCVYKMSYIYRISLSVDRLVDKIIYIVKGNLW